MKLLANSFLVMTLLLGGARHDGRQNRSPVQDQNQVATPNGASALLGFRSPAAELRLESRFLAVPDPRHAEENLRILTQWPHMAGTPEDLATAEFVAGKFREAGLETEIVPYRVWMNYPAEISVDVTAPVGVRMHGPSRERLNSDPADDDPRAVMPFSGMSSSGDVEAEVVYANYGSPEDFEELKNRKIDVRGKIVLVRYGQNFRGVKTFLAQEGGAAGVILYSDPADDGWSRGDAYPRGPWRPPSAVQRGSVGYVFLYAGDPTTPGVASVASLPDAKRVSPERATQLPRIPVTPISAADARPILENLNGPSVPRDWQGALPFAYHLGPGPARVKLHLKQDFQYRTIWNVIGRVRGREFPDEWVIAGNHRDAWIYGAVDPGSGTTAMLETVRGIGALLKSGWHPRRTLVLASWDAEEQGLIGSTEWAEEHAAQLGNAAAYLNIDWAVSGPNFGASAVPSLKEFVREAARSVPSPKGETVYDAWRASFGGAFQTRDLNDTANRQPAAGLASDAPVGDLGGGSDYSPFLQHLGVPATDIVSTGPSGVYHSAFDNFAWFRKFADPDFVYEQQMARVFGIEMLRLAEADALPYDYEEYGLEIGAYLRDAERRASTRFGASTPRFTAAEKAVTRLTRAGESLREKQRHPPSSLSDLTRLNSILRQAERAFLIPEGLPLRPWYRHAIYAPGMYTGYAPVVLPGINEAIDKGDAELMLQQLEVLTSALNRAEQLLSGYR